MWLQTKNTAMSKYIIILVLSVLSLGVKAGVDTIIVSDINPTYVEYPGNLIFCDIAVYKNDPPKKVINDSNGLKIITSELLLQARDGMLIIKAKKPSKPTKLLLKTSNNTYELAVVFADLQGDIKYYHLEKQTGTKESAGTVSTDKDGYADINDLPEMVDIKDKREMLKYNEADVKFKMDRLLGLKDDYQDVGQMDNHIEAIVTGIMNDKTHFYIKLRVTNKSPVDLKLESTSFQYVKVTKDRAVSKKKEEKSDLNNVIKKESDVIPGKEQKHFVYAVPIFAIDDKSYILITINEYQGDRDLELKIYDKNLKKSIQI